MRAYLPEREKERGRTRRKETTFACGKSHEFLTTQTKPSEINATRDPPTSQYISRREIASVSLLRQNSWHVARVIERIEHTINKTGH